MVFEDARLDDRIDGTALLAHAAENAFGEIDVVSRRPARAVGALLRFDRDRQRGTDRLAQFASDTSLFAVRIAAKRVQSAEALALRRRFLGELAGHFALEHVTAGEAQSLQQLDQEPRAEQFANALEHGGTGQ